MVGNGARVTVTANWIVNAIGLGLVLTGLGLLAIAAAHPSATLIVKEIEREISNNLGDSWLGKRWQKRVAARQSKRLRVALKEIAHYEFRVDSVSGPLMVFSLDELVNAVRYGGDNYREVFQSARKGEPWQLSVRNTDRFPHPSLPNRSVSEHTVIAPMKGDF